MISLEAMRELFDYNYWARDRQLEACAALTEEQLLRPMGAVPFGARHARPPGGRGVAVARALAGTFSESVAARRNFLRWTPLQCAGQRSSATCESTWPGSQRKRCCFP